MIIIRQKDFGDKNNNSNHKGNNNSGNNNSNKGNNNSGNNSNHKGNNNSGNNNSNKGNNNSGNNNSNKGNNNFEKSEFKRYLNKVKKALTSSTAKNIYLGTGLTLGAAGLIYGGKKLYDREKEKESNEKVRGKFNRPNKNNNDQKNFSENDKTSGYIAGILGTGALAGMGTTGYQYYSGMKDVKKNIDKAMEDKTKKLVSNYDKYKNAATEEFNTAVSNYKGKTPIDIDELYELYENHKITKEQDKLLDAYEKMRDAGESKVGKRLAAWDVADKKKLSNYIENKASKKVAKDSLKTGGKVALGTAGVLGTIYGGKKLYDHYKNNKL